MKPEETPQKVWVHECPDCHQDDMTTPLARISKTMMEWICNRCGTTFNVEME